MKYLKLYENFEEIDLICHTLHLENYVINKDGTVSVDGEVDITAYNLLKLPLNCRDFKNYQII